METIEMKPYTISCTSCPSKKASGEDGPYDPSCRFSCCVLKESLTCRSRTCRSRMEEPPCPCLLRGASSCPLREGQAYSRALVSLRGRPGPSMLREMVAAKARLHQAMCRSPNDDDEVDEESPEEMQEELQEDKAKAEEVVGGSDVHTIKYRSGVLAPRLQLETPSNRATITIAEQEEQGEGHMYRSLGDTLTALTERMGSMTRDLQGDQDIPFIDHGEDAADYRTIDRAARGEKEPRD